MSSAKVDVLGIPVEPANMHLAKAAIHDLLVQGMKGYVCLVGVHGIMEAQRDSALAYLYRHAALMLPDGMPTVWMGRLQGFSQMRRVAGPDLMLEIFRDQRFSDRRHYLYGGKPGVVDELEKNLLALSPGSKIVGRYTPPFRDLNQDERNALICDLKNTRAELIWIGISTPRQERFMHDLSQELQSGLFFGVGAAFDYHTGRIKDAPSWVKAIGMQWFHRMLQNPKHLFWRYFRNNPEFILRATMQVLLKTKSSVPQEKIESAIATESGGNR